MSNRLAPRALAVSLHDVEDVERFVRATIHRRPGKPLDPSVEEELVREGIHALIRLADKYEPGFGGRDPAGSRFSGYAAKYLPGKLDDALHRLSGDILATHVDAVCPTDGCNHKQPWHERYVNEAPDCPDHTVPLVRGEPYRRWEYADPTDSLERIQDATVSGLDGVQALHTSDATDSTLAATMERLASALDQQWQRDRKQTMSVAEMLAEGYAPPAIAATLGIRTAEVTEAIDRMRRVAHIVVGMDT